MSETDELLGTLAAHRRGLYMKVADLSDEDAAKRTTVSELATLDVAHPLPDAPWYPPDTSWSARQVVIHILTETTRHAGHADILRETLDGARG